MFGSPERPVHVPTDHDLRPNPLNRDKQLAAAHVLDPARVQIQDAINMTMGRLMRHQDVNASGIAE